MYDVLEVCRHIINYCNDKDYGISNLKLQKLLYFIQAYFLIASPNHKACFYEPIEAWDFGPVVPVAYGEYKQYGSTNIPHIDYYYNNSWSNLFRSPPIKFNDDVITSEDKLLIDAVIEKLKSYSATDLVKITHEAIRRYFDADR